MTTVKTYCRNCPSICGLQMEVEDNQIKSVAGDPEHPLTEGYLCIKGMTSGEWQNGDDRLTGSLVRRPDGQFEPIEFEQALDEIHEKLTSIIDQHGPESVAMYYGTGANNNSLCHPAMKGWLHGVGSPYIFSSMTIDQSAKWVTAGRMGMFLTGKYNVTDADVIMLVGNNPLVSHSTSGMPMTNPLKWLREAKKRGAKLIVVDPRRTETAKRADIHLAIDPGEDVALFAGLIRIVLENGWHDEKFCEKFVEGLDELRASVEPFTLDVVAARVGVTKDELISVAATFAKAGKKSAHTSTGPNMCPQSNTAEHMIEAFNAICGGYRREGDTITNLRPILANVFPKEMVMPALRPWESGPKCKSADVGPMFGEYPTALLPREIKGSGDKKIRALISVGGNPVKAIPDPIATSDAFEDLQLHVTLDPRMNETCEKSHYVIATSLPYERHDFTGMYDLYLSYSYANATKPAVQRPDGVVDDWEFFWGLSKRAGRSLEMKLPMFGASHAENPTPVLELDPENKPTTEDIIRSMCSHGFTSYEELLQAPQGILFEDKSAVIESADADCPRLTLCPPDVAEEMRECVNRPKSDKPYRLAVRRMLESMNTAYSNAGATRRRYPVNPLFMNPDDMSSDKIENGQKVEIRSAHGIIRGTAQADPGLKRGTVSMTHGWGALKSEDDPDASQGSNAGALISLNDPAEPINYMPVMSAIPVDVFAAN